MASSAPWPSPGDYSAAIQNPHNCFADPELARGYVHANQFGLPVGASGNFAVVYQLHSGAQVFAVRCFIRPVTNQQQRYDALSQHLHGIWLPALVDYAYLPRGIRVRGQWYPVVRMAWIAGQQLHQYIEDHLRHSQLLERLAIQWRGVVAGLCGAHMAHGDLQHGNILVDGHDQLHLVDYDGFFIPALHTQPPGERGHPNYQHPERQQHGYYAANVDAFSALVIYLSLLALRTEPGLWSWHTGENLLFKGDDFTQPGRTPMWQRLQGSLDPEVQRLTATLERFCREPVSAIPDLDTVIQGLSERSAVPAKLRLTPPPPALLSPPAPSQQSAPALPLPGRALESPAGASAALACGDVAGARGAPRRARRVVVDPAPHASTATTSRGVAGTCCHLVACRLLCPGRDGAAGSPAAAAICSRTVWSSSQPASARRPLPAGLRHP